MSSYEEDVLAGILPNRVDLLAKALLQLDAELHFRNENNRVIFTLMKRYYDTASAVLSPAVMARILENGPWDAAKRIALGQTYDALFKREVNAPEQRWAVHQLREIAAETATGETIAESMEILERGWSHPRKTEGKELKGHAAARQYLFTRLHEIETVSTNEAAPEGNIREEGPKAMEAYTDHAAGKLEIGVRTGLSAIDNQVGGLRNGELVLLVAYTGQGKSMLATQIAWNTVVNEGRDVFFGTSETVREQVKRRIWARHSRLPQFNYPGGIDAQAIKNGKLTDKELKVFGDVLDDLKDNPNYGDFHIAQLPRDATVNYVETRLREYGKQHPDVALCVIDYLALLKATRRRQTTREEFDEIINDAKHMATNFGEGRGIPVLSPWSVHQTAYLNAIKNRTYTLANLAETSVAEKSADMIVALLREQGATKEAFLQFLKVRDGELPQLAELDIDFKTTYISVRDNQDSFAADTKSDADLFAGF